MKFEPTQRELALLETAVRHELAESKKFHSDVANPGWLRDQAKKIEEYDQLLARIRAAIPPRDPPDRNWLMGKASGYVTRVW